MYWHEGGMTPFLLFGEIFEASKAGAAEGEFVDEVGACEFRSPAANKPIKSKRQKAGQIRCNFMPGL